jgi:hypothetical protein
MEATAKVPLEIRKQCLSLASQQIARLTQPEERVPALTAFLEALPKILPSTQHDRKQVSAFFEEVYRAARKENSPRSLIALMPISCDLVLQREPEIAVDIVGYLIKTESQGVYSIEFWSSLVSLEKLIAHGFGREVVEAIDHMPTDTDDAKKRKFSRQRYLLHQIRFITLPEKASVSAFNSALDEVIDYVQCLPEQERTPLRQSLGEMARCAGRHQIANTIFEEIALSASKEKNPVMLFQAAKWRFQDASSLENPIVPLDVSWRDRVQTALTWKSSPLIADVNAAFLGCGAWQEALKFVQKNYAGQEQDGCLQGDCILISDYSL